MLRNSHISGSSATCAPAATAMERLKRLTSLRPERQGEQMGLQIIAPVSTELAQIGTFAHEMGHRLGAVIQEWRRGFSIPITPSCTTCAAPARNGHGGQRCCLLPILPVRPYLRQGWGIDDGRPFISRDHRGLEQNRAHLPEHASRDWPRADTGGNRRETWYAARYDPQVTRRAAHTHPTLKKLPNRAARRVRLGAQSNTTASKIRQPGYLAEV